MNTWIAVFVGIVAYEVAGSIVSRALDRSRFGSRFGRWCDVKGIQLRDWLIARRERRQMKWD